MSYSQQIHEQITEYETNRINEENETVNISDFESINVNTNLLGMTPFIDSTPDFSNAQSLFCTPIIMNFNNAVEFDSNVLESSLFIPLNNQQVGMVIDQPNSQSQTEQDTNSFNLFNMSNINNEENNKTEDLKPQTMNSTTNSLSSVNKDTMLMGFENSFSYSDSFCNLDYIKKGGFPENEIYQNNCDYYYLMHDIQKNEFINVKNKPRVKRQYRKKNISASYNSELRCHYPNCNKLFTRQYNLKTHYRIHTKERPFKCSYCDYTFSRQHDMKRHMNLHSGIKPFSCKYCGKAFARLDALNRHIKKDQNTCSGITRSNSRGTKKIEK